MSAFLCSPPHLSAIVNVASRDTLRRFAERIQAADPVQVPNTNPKVRSTKGGISLMALVDDRPQPEDILFHALHRENLRSLDYRYPKEDGSNNTTSDWVTGEPPEYVHAYNVNVNPVSALKQIACYEYQSCEHPEWNISLVKEFCDWAKSDAIKKLPGYEEAPWGL